MKFPEDKSERNRIFLVIGIVSVTIVYAGYTYALSPYLAKRRQTLNRVVELEDKLWKARQSTNLSKMNRTKNISTIDQILAISEEQRQVLHPNLGNYLLVAADIIGRHADALGLEIKSINETVKQQNDPSKAGSVENEDKDINGPRLKDYTVNVTLSCGLHDAIKLIRAIESENQYLCITRLAVISRPESPTEHSVSFDIEWPIWADPNHPVELAAQRMTDQENR